MQIERVEVRVVAPKVQRFTWSHDLQEQYMTNTIVRITTEDGAEGVGGVSNYTSYDYDRYTCETLRHMIPALVGKDPLSRETLWRGLRPAWLSRADQPRRRADPSLGQLDSGPAGVSARLGDQVLVSSAD